MLMGATAEPAVVAPISSRPVGTRSSRLGHSSGRAPFLVAIDTWLFRHRDATIYVKKVHVTQQVCR